MVVGIARSHGVLGRKVNGAGGKGGTLDLLCGDRSSERRVLVKAVEASRPLFKNGPVYLSRQG